MTIRVIELLEVIDIEHDDGELRSVAPSPVQLQRLFIEGSGFGGLIFWLHPGVGSLVDKVHDFRFDAGRVGEHHFQKVVTHDVADFG